MHPSAWRPLLGCAFLATILHQAPCQALVVLRVEQDGNDVLVRGSGSANTFGLTPDGTSTTWTNTLTDGQIYAGPPAFDDGHVSLFTGVAGPLTVGSVFGVYELPDASSSGDLFGILADDGAGASKIVLPAGYISRSSLSGISRFPNLALTQIGLSPGQVSTWSWGSGDNADSLRLEVFREENVPAPVPLLGVLAGLRMARSLRRRQQAAAK